MKLGRLDRAPACAAWGALGAAGLMLAGCDRAGPGAGGNAAAPSSATAAATSAAAGVRTLPAPEQLQRAFRTVFGKAPPAIEPDGANGPDGTTIAEKLLWIGDTAVLVTTTSYEDGGHVQVGALGIYYLDPAGDGFVVKDKWPKAVSGNGFGRPPSSWSVTDRFGTPPTLYSEAGWTGMGYVCSSFDLTELAPGGPRSVASVPASYDDSGAAAKGAATGIEGKIADIVPGKSFTVHYTGAATFAETWVRTGDRYVLKGKTRMLTC